MNLCDRGAVWGIIDLKIKHNEVTYPWVRTSENDLVLSINLRITMSEY